ncbi:methyltransferase domain-containing protein [Fulvivirga sp. 29W222]|uniref:Methyltransferase domain-containing protein n=1 Tax=Fulvivirga marina TaxID=2494733 RepID=A0A937FXZ5_9BACT|nr:class I SAM-dependent methyltransferase [Fulvivirga marina]MBL6448109.1 methyltransferase domain-containing protein [Fulvivirga marina]
MNYDHHQESESACRFCGTPLTYTFVDLGMSPLCQDHVKPWELKDMEPFYPLHAYVCDNCFLVQLEEFVPPSKIYEDYAYFSSYSDSWLKHAKDYTEKVTKRFDLNSKKLVVELASNDGYLLQYFKEKDIPVLGVEPAANVAEHAINKGIKTEVKFFGNKTVFEIIMKHGEADLLIGNNVLAHVPDINDFVSAMKILLKPEGVITMEFPHLLRLIEGNQFDTIYHEHFSYLSFSSVERIFSYHGLTIFDVEELPTHGGSLRIYACQKRDTSKTVSSSVRELRMREHKAGMETIAYYRQFAERVKETKRNILDFLISVKRKGKTVVGYGAPGKGNTLLNYCGIRTDFIDFTVDRNPHKQGNYLPGTLIPIYHPDMIKRMKPDYVFILPWNLKEEIVENISYIGEWDGKFVVPIPELRVYSAKSVDADPSFHFYT